MKISRAGLEYIAKKEGFAETPYNDPPGSAKYSIGYGHQIQSGENLTRVNKEQALNLLAADTASANATVSRYITRPLTQVQHDALVSFVFNVGSGNFSTGSVPKKINAGDFKGAAATIRQYNKIHVGNALVESPALTARRNEEAVVFDV